MSPCPRSYTTNQMHVLTLLLFCGSDRGPSCAMPICNQHIPIGTAGEVELLPIVGCTTKDDVGDSCLVLGTVTLFRRNNAGPGDPVLVDHKDATKRWMTYEEIALFIHCQTIRTGRAKGIDYNRVSAWAFRGEDLILPCWRSSWRLTESRDLGRGTVGVQRA